MANNVKVMSSIKDFLIKLKACDANIPEELAEDACSMVEEVKDALAEEEVEIKDSCKDEEPEEEKKEEPKDEETISKKDVEKVVEDSMTRVLRNLGLIKDSAMAALDEVENKLGEEKKESEDEMNEEEVTVDPEKMNDSLKRELLRAVKPVIADVKDAKQRKILSDNFAKALNMSQTYTNDYSTILSMTRSNAKDAMTAPTSQSDYDYGMEIAKKYNPHYKEEN